MKRRLLLPASVSCILLMTLPIAAETNDIDFSSFARPAKGGQFVEVNLKGNILGMAARLAEKDEPEAAQLLKSIQSIHIHVVGLDDSNRASTEKRIEEIRSQLESKGWEKNVTVVQDRNDVSVYSKVRRDEAVEGLVVTVINDHKQAIVVNVVGDIRPEMVATLGERFDIEPLKHLDSTLGKHGNRKHASKESVEGNSNK